MEKRVWGVVCNAIDITTKTTKFARRTNLQSGDNSVVWR